MIKVGVCLFLFKIHLIEMFFFRLRWSSSVLLIVNLTNGISLMKKIIPTLMSLLTSFTLMLLMSKLVLWPLQEGGLGGHCI